MSSREMQIRKWQPEREPSDIRHLRELWDEGIASGKAEPVNFSRFWTEARRKVANGKRESR